jgi:hypothetical protein
LLTVKEPVPLEPTDKLPKLVQSAVDPETVAVPLDPTELAMTPFVLYTSPCAPVMLRVPVLVSPTISEPPTFQGEACVAGTLTVAPPSMTACADAGAIHASPIHATGDDKAVVVIKVGSKSFSRAQAIKSPKAFQELFLGTIARGSDTPLGLEDLTIWAL